MIGIGPDSIDLASEWLPGCDESDPYTVLASFFDLASERLPGCDESDPYTVLASFFDEGVHMLCMNIPHTSFIIFIISSYFPFVNAQTHRRVQV